MKLNIIVALLALSIIHAYSQQATPIPLYQASVGMSEADDAYRQQQAAAAAEAARAKADHEQELRDGYAEWTGKLNSLTSNPTAYFRLVDDETNSLTEFDEINGKVLQITADGILLITPEAIGGHLSYSGPVVLIADYSHSVIDEQLITVQAMRAGRYSYVTTGGANKTIAKFKCGIPVMPSAELIKIKADAIRNQIAFYEDQIKAEAAQIAAAHAAAEAKKKSSQDRALKANMDAAAKGDAYGLLRMGERYRDGEGVEKDSLKAKEYLRKAADAGSPTAEEELSHLQLTAKADKN